MKQFTDYIENAIKEAQAKERELVAADRKDEANLERIRANVFDICSTVLRALSKAKSKEELEKEYLNRMEAITKNWHSSYEKAKEHNDVTKILIEETKLAVWQEVREKFQSLYVK